MVDTVRTQAQLITASADNTTGAWSNQNERDFIVTAAAWSGRALNRLSGLAVQHGQRYDLRSGHLCPETFEPTTKVRRKP